MQLKHYGYVLATATALAAILAAATIFSPAHAYNYGDPIPKGHEPEPGDSTGNATPGPDKWSFVCKPNGKLEHERDPVVRVRITADFVGDWVLTNFTVQHETFSGRVYDRGEQYSSVGTFGRPDEKEYIWVWNGVLKDDPNHTVTGGLQWNTGEDNRWHYAERHVTHTVRKVRKGRRVYTKTIPHIEWIWTTCLEAKRVQPEPETK